ncbi:hypothetical protein [Actinomadura sp. 9N407]|uniref:hypothetical protein n=1 Tax=Actinomadura sp. 9N407 TaxID=3375154 RepID=UPI0037966A9C
MLSRSAGGSLLAGLGTAAVLAVATAPPVIAEPEPLPSGENTETPTNPPDPSDPPTTGPTDPPTTGPTDPPDPPDPSDPPDPPDPSDPPDPPDPPDPTDPPDPPDPTTPPDPGTPVPAKPALSLGISVSASTVKPGGTITATARVTSAHATAHGTVLRLATTNASVSPAAQGLGSVSGTGRTAQATIKAPSNAKPGTIMLKATVSASKATSVSRSYRLILTSATGALPPGISLSSLPPDVPPLTSPAFNAVAGIPAPQVALPPVASPQIAPSPMPMVPMAGLRRNLGDPFDSEDLAALQAGWLAAMTVSIGLMLARTRLARRNALPREVRRRLAGRLLTEARLRTLPPQPAPVPSRLTWLPLHFRGAVRI